MDKDELAPHIIAGKAWYSYILSIEQLNAEVERLKSEVEELRSQSRLWLNTTLPDPDKVYWKAECMKARAEVERLNDLLDQAGETDAWRHKRYWMDRCLASEQEIEGIVGPMRGKVKRQGCEDWGDALEREGLCHLDDIPDTIIAICEYLEAEGASINAPDVEKASEIVRDACGSRPDLMSGKDYVDEVRGHPTPSLEDSDNESRCPYCLRLLPEEKAGEPEEPIPDGYGEL